MNKEKQSVTITVCLESVDNPVFTIKQDEKGNYEFTNRNIEEINEFCRYRYRYAKTAFSKIYEIVRKETVQAVSGDPSHEREWLVFIEEGDTSKLLRFKNPNGGIADFRFWKFYLYSPITQQAQTSWNPKFTIEDLRLACQEKYISIEKLYDSFLINVFDTEDMWFYNQLEVGKEGTRIVHYWYYDIKHKEITIDKEGFLIDTGQIELLDILKQEGVKIKHNYPEGVYPLAGY